MAAAIKKTISDAQLQKELFKLFNGGNTAKSNIYEQLRTKFKMMKQRYLKAYDVALVEWQKIQQKAQAEQTTENTKEGLKSGLKSKIQRQLEIQAMLEPDYLVDESRYGANGKKIKSAFRKLDPTEIKNLHAELSKMDGSYAATKIEGEFRELRPLFGDKDEILEK